MTPIQNGWHVSDVDSIESVPHAAVPPPIPIIEEIYFETEDYNLEYDIEEELIIDDFCLVFGSRAIDDMKYLD